MAEIYGDAEQFLKAFVMLQEKIIVGRRRLHLWIPLLDPQKCLFKILDGNREDLLDERLADLAIDNGEEDALPRLSRDNEIEFDVADTAPLICDVRPLFNEFSARELLVASSPPVPFLFPVEPEPGCRWHTIRTPEPPIDRIL